MTKEKIKLNQSNWILLAAALMLASNAVLLNAQSLGVCSDSTDRAAWFYLHSYESLVSNNDAASVAFRASSGLPTLAPSQVRLVKDSAVCRTASLAYDAQLETKRPTAPVIVLELGTKRIVIKDTGMPSRWLNMLFNADFSTLLTTLGL